MLRRLTGLIIRKGTAMPIIFSRTCEYALQAVLYLASQPPDTPILQRDISRALNIPTHFLGKVLQLLSRSGLVISRKGKTGGFLLARAPKNISLHDIVEAIDGTDFLDACILGFPGCGDDSPCPVHSKWKPAKQIILQMLENSSVEALSKELGPELGLVQK
ncbi:Rrf2 family transcriptional regulator [Acidobacteria bacterium AH-259-D05]|nr:Rrf2 family transcriptional regulator [Acidobacteria bacterium AH-259-D05]